MDARYFRYFIAVAEELHFGRAAARLGMAQPPLSQRIRALERQLGVTLLKRSSRRAELTDAGKLFLVEAKRALAQIDHACAIAREAERGHVGEINVGLTASLPLTPSFRKLYQHFQLKYPGVRLVLHEMSTQQQIDALHGGRLHVGFPRTSGARPVSDTLGMSIFGREELLIVVGHDHPLAKTDPKARISPTRLAQDRFVFFTREMGGSTYDQVISMCRSAGFEPRVAQEARQVVTLIGLVAAGAGITLVSSSYRDILTDKLTVRRLKPPAPMATTWLARRKDDDSPLTMSFVALAG
jgi:DNA-binding transcriptional LysR family regulator